MTHSPPKTFWSIAILLLMLGAAVAWLTFAARLLVSFGDEQDLAALREQAKSSLAIATSLPLELVASTAAAIVTSVAPERASRSWQIPLPDQSLWSKERIAAYRAQPKGAAAWRPPEGVLRIPAVDMAVPVYTGTDRATLNRGAGRVAGTAPLGSPGNVGVAAHRDGFFRPLKDVIKGDRIVVETIDRALRYEVDDIRIVQPQDVDVLATTTARSSMTLITAYPFYFVGSAPLRLVVHATLLDADVF
jgi:LPXTG-site transpeptidase (sortase) family protein